MQQRTNDFSSQISSQKNFNRLKTKVVKIGNVYVGGENPICVQSMITSDTNAVEKAVEEIKEIYDAGARIVRLSTPNQKAVISLEKIKSSLLSQNYNIPLVADVHFTPNVAIFAAEIVEKVRINPGNFVNKKRFSEKILNETEYKNELHRIEEKFVPLLEVCKKNNTALRIGVNHGSLSDRIVTHYGDNPQGMVVSALEFLEIAKKNDFDQIVFSMKSSNPIIMVHAYRLLVAEMQKTKDIYPLHLGVTEAGDEQQGRVKSTVGIATLLIEGLGDTVRISLTEPSKNEIPVAKKIVAISQQLKKNDESLFLDDKKIEIHYPINFSFPKTTATKNFGGNNIPKVLFFSTTSWGEKEDFSTFGFSWLPQTKKWKISDVAYDGVLMDEKEPKNKEIFPPMLRFYKEKIDDLEEKELKEFFHNINIFSWYRTKEEEIDEQLLFFKANEMEQLLQNKEYCEKMKLFPPSMLVLDIEKQSTKKLRMLIDGLRYREINFPVALWINTVEMSPEKLSEKSGPDEKKSWRETRLVNITATTAPLFIDGLAQCIIMNVGDAKENSEQKKEDLETIFFMLQAVRQRIVKPEYISCPSCGRTLFNLQQVTKKIKEKTSHLKGVKIGIMGCIVNGPGEMADADFGYVGSSSNMVTLYKGKEVVQKNISEANAVDALIDLIKKNGMWQEKEDTI